MGSCGVEGGGTKRIDGDPRYSSIYVILCVKKRLVNMSRLMEMMILLGQHAMMWSCLRLFSTET